MVRLLSLAMDRGLLGIIPPLILSGFPIHMQLNPYLNTQNSV